MIMSPEMQLLLSFSINYKNHVHVGNNLPISMKGHGQQIRCPKYINK